MTKREDKPLTAIKERYESSMSETAFTDAICAAYDLGRLNAATRSGESPQPRYKEAVIEILSNCAARYVNPERVICYDPQSVIDKQIDNGVEILKKFFGPSAPQPTCKGCKKGMHDYFEHDKCLVAIAVGMEQARWQHAIFELARKHAIAPDDIDGSGCDSGDPLDLTLAEVGQVICQLENPQDYRESGPSAPQPQPQQGDVATPEDLSRGIVCFPCQTENICKAFKRCKELRDREEIPSAPSGSAGQEPLRRCSDFSPQFGQCVYNSDHKGGHLYAQPSEG